jgi:predicted GTPase
MQGEADEGGLSSVMGPTGAGKSRVCRLVKRSHFFSESQLSVRQFIDIATQQAQSANVGHSLESCTSEVRAVRYQRTDGNGKRSYVIVDTPGFDDTNKPDTEILALIADWLKTTYVFGILSRLRYLITISLFQLQTRRASCRNHLSSQNFR